MVEMLITLKIHKKHCTEGEYQSVYTEEKKKKKKWYASKVSLCTGNI